MKCIAMAGIRSRRMVRQMLLAATVASLPAYAFGLDKYYDTDGATTGLQGGVGVWDVATTSVWNTASAGDAAITVWNNGDAAFFQTGVVNTVTPSGSIQANAITQTGAGTATTIAAGGSIQISTTSGIVNTGDQALIINTPLALPNTNTIFSSSAAAAEIRLTGSNVISGAGGFVVTGGGLVNALVASHTYTGGTTITAGTYRFAGQGSFTGSGATSFGTTASPITLNGGTMELGSTSGGKEVRNPITISAASTISNIATGGTGARTLNLSGVITDTGAGFGFTKVGSEPMALSGAAANTYRGTTIVQRGTLTLQKTAGLNATGTGNIEITGVSGGGSAVALGASNQINNSSSVTVNGGGGQPASFNLADFSETIQNLTVTTNTTFGGRVATGATGVLTVNGKITLANNRNSGTGNSARHVLITGTGTTSAATATGFLDLAGSIKEIETTSSVALANTDAMIETVIQNGGINKTGAEQLYLGAANTYAGGTTVTAGNLIITATGSLGAGNVTVLSTAGKLEIQTTNPGAIDDMAKLTLAGGGSATTADNGYIALGDGVNEIVGSLVLGSVTKTALGTYGSSTSGANFQDNQYFSGNGVVSLVPEPASLGLIAMAGVGLLARRRRTTSR